MTNKLKSFIAALAAIIIVLCMPGCTNSNMESGVSTTSAAETSSATTEAAGTSTTSITQSESNLTIPEYNGEPYAILNNNIPEFDKSESSSVFETYSDFDSLGRCGVAYANICKQLMPTEERGEIGAVKPSGWNYNGKSNNHKYDFVDGKYIYNRCHLIGFQLAGENANEKNLITGTRYMNVDGMLPFENMVADHIKEEGGHVLYRVTPVFVDNELVCRGVQIEAYSVEDSGEDICFNVFCFNVQPGVTINYLTGENYLSSETTTTKASISVSQQYVINENSKKFHTPDCSAVKKISADNKLVLIENRDSLISQGYSPCGICKP